MKKRILPLGISLLLLALGACQGAAEPAPTAVPPTASLLLSATPQPTATATLEPSPAPSLTPSLEQIYGVPEGWKVYPGEPPSGFEDFPPALSGFRFALPDEWTCHEEPDDLATTWYCILDDEFDRFANERKTTLRLTPIGMLDPPYAHVANLAADIEEGQQFYGYTCETRIFTIDGLQAASLACVNPAYDDQIDYDADRDAYGKARSQVPEFFVVVLNGRRIDQFHFRTWEPAQMPPLFEELVPYIGYDSAD